MPKRTSAKASRRRQCTGRGVLAPAEPANCGRMATKGHRQGSARRQTGRSSSEWHRLQLRQATGRGDYQRLPFGTDVSPRCQATLRLLQTASQRHRRDVGAFNAFRPRWDTVRLGSRQCKRTARASLLSFKGWRRSPFAFGTRVAVESV